MAEKLISKKYILGFKTPAGVFAICGLHVLPIWLYGLRTGLWLPFMTHHSQLGVAGVLVTGRALCMSVEVSLGSAVFKRLKLSCLVIGLQKYFACCWSNKR